jgi:hypothetical protein
MQNRAITLGYTSPSGAAAQFRGMICSARLENGCRIVTVGVGVTVTVGGAGVGAARPATGLPNRRPAGTG